jgi:F-type H+-transporting ATPase subunit epsilon
MAETMQFDLVSPERSLASLKASAVQMPGAEGDMTVMPEHAPLITTLRPGILKVESADGASEYVLTGGFAQITGGAVSVLAEKAIPMGELTRSHIEELIEEARLAHEKAKEDFQNQPGLVDDAAKLLADMVAMGDHISI